NNYTSIDNKLIDYKFMWIPAIRSQTRGRASGGCYFGYKKELVNLKCEFLNQNHLTYVKLQINNKTLLILPLYLNCNNWDEDFDNLGEIFNTISSSKIMLIGDLNGRIGQVAGTINEAKGINRQTKDVVCNTRGKRIIELCDSFGLRILNGTMPSDVSGDFTFVGGQGSSTIDYSMIGEDWEPFVTDFEVRELPYSDHLPIVVTLRMTGHSTVVNNIDQLLPRLNWKLSKASLYRQRLDTNLHNRQNTDFRLLDQIVKASYPQQQISTTRNKIRVEPWFDEECQKARRISFAWLRNFRNSPQGQFRNIYIEANTTYKKLCKSKKREYEERQAARLTSCNNASTFWKLAWELNGKKPPIHKNLCANMLAEHFRKLLNPEMMPSIWQYATPGITNEILDSQFTAQELEQALCTLKDGKAAGANGIPAEFYKYGTSALNDRLLTMFNEVIEGNLVVNEFQEAVIFPIHKKGSYADASNYRGISFLNATYKILTTMMQKRLNKWIKSQNILKEFQAAAFDTINRGALFYKLYNAGLSMKFGRALENLYRGTRAAVWNGAELSDWFVTSSGVRQGCTLSPTLFSLFINDLIDYLPGGVDFAGTHMKALLFADDIVMFAYSPEALQLMINRLYNYCCLWNLIVNTQKSKVMIFKNGGGRNASNEKWSFNGEALECVTEYKYLGVIFTRSLSMQKHLTVKLEKAKTAINISWKRCFMNRNIAHSSKHKVFEAVSESILLYGAQVWGCMRFQTVEKLLTHYIKRIFSLPVNTPNYVVMLETGLSPLHIKTLKLQADFLQYIFNLSESRLVKKVAISAIHERNSWYREWSKLAEECNLSFDLNLENIGSCKTLFYNVISKVDEKCRAEYIAEASSSIYRTVYSRLNHNLAEKNYFHDSYKVNVIATMVRLRSELINLNFMPHRPDLPLECSICNMKEREDVIHFLGRCPTLKETRRSVLGSDVLSEEQVLDELNQMNVNRLYEYCVIALRYRARIIKEDF
ncbi:uncharacterized protein LOC129953526, partial [Eupeodes corollae]|uniref:uncharacterized protein LOC129953526 n=1 Tax=Eupeodes corollae TaxID=290404 RepID=UPI00249055C1